jgi:phosphinothricin acetyltransferase
VVRIYRPYVTDSVATFELQPPDADEIARRMTAAPRLPWLLALRNEEPVGYAYASHHRARPAYRWSVEVSVYLRADERRRGTGRALYDQLLPLVRDLGYVSLYAGVTLPNPGSVALHEVCGFTPLGVFRAVGHKFGAWHDVGWWQLSPDEPPAQPAEPRTWTP